MCEGFEVVLETVHKLQDMLKHREFETENFVDVRDLTCQKYI